MDQSTAKIPYLGHVGRKLCRVWARDDDEACRVFQAVLEADCMAYLGLAAWPEDGVLSFGFTPESEFRAVRGATWLAGHVADLTGDEPGDTFIVETRGGDRLFRIRADSGEEARARWLRLFKGRFDTCDEVMREDEFIALHGTPADVADVGEGG